jgi:leader peptidase (prepilin peptidase)/N-methyltransferase
MIVWLWLAVFFAWLFVLGSAVGSFLNVVIYRLPRGKSLFWPPSRCGACLAPISFRDNVPLLSYWKLRGRCRACGAAFSVRYFLVELACGLVFALLYFVEIGRNIHGLDVWREGGLHYLESGRFPPDGWPFFAAHMLLAALLITGTACVLDTGRLPRALAVIGAVAGLGWNLLYPWPTPSQIGNIHLEAIPPGFVPWPAWWPPPEWMPPGGLLLGLVTGLAGLLVGSGLLRLVNALHRATSGEEVFGPSGPMLFLMVGGFLGWQPVVVALLAAALLMHPLSRLAHSPEESFVLAGVVGIVLAWLGWRWIGPVARPWLLDPLRVVLVLAGLTAVLSWLGDVLRKRFL